MRCLFKCVLIWNINAILNRVVSYIEESLKRPLITPIINFARIFINILFDDDKDDACQKVFEQLRYILTKIVICHYLTLIYCLSGQHLYKNTKTNDSNYSHDDDHHYIQHHTENSLKAFYLTLLNICINVTFHI